MTTIREYRIERIRTGHKVTGYQVTDGIWYSIEYKTLAEARKHLRKAAWGEGVNTL